MKEANVFAFYRLARRYCLVYGSGEKFDTITDIKKLVAVRKSHRNILDTHHSVINEQLHLASVHDHERSLASLREDLEQNELGF